MDTHTGASYWPYRTYERPRELSHTHAHTQRPIQLTTYFDRMCARARARPCGFRAINGIHSRAIHTRARIRKRSFNDYMRIDGQFISRQNRGHAHTHTYRHMGWYWLHTEMYIARQQPASAGQIPKPAQPGDSVAVAAAAAAAAAAVVVLGLSGSYNYMRSTLLLS